jgi:hypothetical protein
MDTKLNRLLALASDVSETRKEWKAPELKKGEIAMLTASLFAAGDDGLGPGTANS